MLQLSTLLARRSAWGQWCEIKLRLAHLARPLGSFPVFKICTALMPVVLLSGCVSRSQGQQVERSPSLIRSVYVKDDAAVGKIPELLSEYGIQLRALTPTAAADRGHLDWSAALSLAWLSSLSYGSARQIADQLLEAQFIDEQNYAQVQARATLLASLRALQNAMHLPEQRSDPEQVGLGGLLSASDFTSYLEHSEQAFRILPKFYRALVVLKSADYLLNGAGPITEDAIRLQLDDELRTLLSTPKPGGMLVQVFPVEETEAALNLVRMTSVEDAVAFGKAASFQQKTRTIEWVKDSNRMDILSEKMFEILINHCRRGIRTLLQSSPALSDALERTNVDLETLSPLRALSLYAEAIEGFEEAGQLMLITGGQYRMLQGVVFDEGSTQMLLIEHKNGDDLFVVFRGTSDGKDILTDLNPGMTRLPERGWGSVHSGFFTALNELTVLGALMPTVGNRLVVPKDAGDVPVVFDVRGVFTDAPPRSFFRPTIARALSDAASSGKRIWVTGHSLGGALAVLFAEHLLADQKAYEPHPNDGKRLVDRLQAVITFGAPNVGDSAFAKRLNDAQTEARLHFFRFRYENDLITQLNPTGALARDSVRIQFRKSATAGKGSVGCLIDSSSHGFASGAPYGRQAAGCQTGQLESDVFDGRISKGIADHDFSGYMRAAAQFFGQSSASAGQVE